MKRHPYKTILTTLIVGAITLTILLKAGTVKGALFVTLPPMYGSAPAPILMATTTPGVILDGTSTDIASVPIETAQVKAPIMMSAKAERIIELKQQIASLQNELYLLEQ